MPLARSTGASTLTVTAKDLMHPRSGPLKQRPGWTYELKYDGYLVLARKSGHEVQLVTRNGTDATAWFPGVVAALALVKGDFAVDSEVCLLDASGVPDFEAMRGAAGRRRSKPYVYFAFDILQWGRRDLRVRPLVERRQVLRERFPNLIAPLALIEGIEGEATAVSDLAMKLGMEGVVAKNLAAPYVAGYTDEWIKTKSAGTHDGWTRPRFDAVHRR